MGIAKNHISSTLINIVVFLVPTTILTDWLYDFEIIGTQLGLYLKGVSALLCLYILLNNTVTGFVFKDVLLYFLLLFFFHSLFSDNTINNIYFTIRVAYWILASLTFYTFINNNIISVEKFKSVLVYSALIASVFTIILIRGLDQDEYDNASGYLLLWILPLLLLFRNKRLVQLTIIISVVAILITTKRGAMIALVLSSLGYLIILLKISKSFSSKFRIILGGALLFSIGTIVILNNWDFIKMRFEDTGGSGRDNLYTSILTNYWNNDLFYQIFGLGINAVQKLTAVTLAGDPSSQGVAAHSDWLQYMYDFGVLGVIFMVVMHIKILSLIIYFNKVKSPILPSVIMFYIIFFLTTIYSFVLNTPNAIFLGISVALFSAYKNKLEKNRSIRRYKMRRTLHDTN